MHVSALPTQVLGRGDDFKLSRNNIEVTYRQVGWETRWDCCLFPLQLCTPCLLYYFIHLGSILYTTPGPVTTGVGKLWDAISHCKENRRINSVWLGVNHPAMARQKKVWSLGPKQPLGSSLWLCHWYCLAMAAPNRTTNKSGSKGQDHRSCERKERSSAFWHRNISRAMKAP